MFAVLLAIHILGAVIWVGGMVFGTFILRPSLAVLEPPQRVALLFQIFRRLFLIVWHVWPLMLLTGYAMLFGFLGGFAGVNWAVHVMHLLGLLMVAVFLVVFFAPWRAMRAAAAAGDAATAGSLVPRVRRLVHLNTALGILTVIVAAFA